MEFAQGGTLVGDIGENGARCDDVDGAAFYIFEVVSRTMVKGALVPHTSLHGEGLSVLKHGSGDIDKDCAERQADALNGAKGDKALASADIGKRHSGGEPRAIENAIGVVFEPAAHRARVCRVAAVADM